MIQMTRISRVDRSAQKTVEVFLKVFPIHDVISPQKLAIEVMTRPKINLNYQIQLKRIPKITALR